jgi:GATA-binding protein, other eukaryote
MLTKIGLYYKLHGVHRPVAMKKSIIKRRKRVVPAPQGSQASGVETNNNLGESPEPEDAPPGAVIQDQRGTVNPDGSINLGFRPRTEFHRLSELTAAPRYDSRRQTLPMDSASKAPNLPNHQQDPSLIHNENTLPPMTSYPSPKPRPPSLSPNFLSLNRKRSFESAGADSAPASVPESNTKRLSSIKSILNPTLQPSGDNETIDPNLRAARSPETRYSSLPSPSSFANSPSGSWDTQSGQSGARDTTSNTERAKMERRAELRREAERMREALRAKERELEELNE